MRSPASARLLSLAYAWALIVTHQLDLAQYWLDELLQSLDQHEKQTAGAPILDDLGSVDGVGKVIWSEIRGGLALCQSYLAMASGDMEQAAELSQQATSYLYR